MEKSVSIITVVFNGENTIRRTLENVISQKSSLVEYIVLDGGSTDSTNSIIAEYENDIDYYLSEKDDGLYHAINKGIGIANGHYIGVLHSGDLYLKGTLDFILNDIRRSCEVDIYAGSALLGNKEMIRSELRQLSPKSALILHESLFISSSSFLNNGSYNIDYTISADYEFISRLLARGATVKYMDRVFVQLDPFGISSDSQNARKKLWDLFRVRWKYVGPIYAVLTTIRLLILKKR